ncbi:MAG: beta-galactosidase trimerization domain-containing protein [Candidatus Pacebacteria bacterium]|nr:beta-galactosidase trimerization domain-containing protein [Candidatus Paceibacterota bacterium]
MVRFLEHCREKPAGRRIMIFAFNSPTLKPKRKGARTGNIPELTATIEFAGRPNDNAVVQTITYTTDMGAIPITMGDTSKPLNEYAETIRTFYDFAADRVETLRAQGITEETMPRRILTSTSIRHCTDLYDHKTTMKEAELLRLMGIRYVSGLNINVKRDTHAGVLPFFIHNLNGYRDWLAKKPLKDGFKERTIGQRELKSFADATGFQKGDRLIFKVLDEPKVYTLGELLKLDGILPAFHKWLEKRGITAAEIGFETMDHATPIPMYKVTDEASARLYYLTEWFRQELTMSFWEAYREGAHEIYGDGVICCTSAPPNGFRATPDYFLYSKHGAWDGFLPHYTSSLWVPIHHNMYHANLLLSASKFGKTDTGGLWAPTRIGSGRGTELSGMSGLIRDMHHFFVYRFGPWFGWGFGPDNPKGLEISAAVARFFHNVADIEDIVMDGSSPAPQVALLYSRASEIWYRRLAIFEDLMYSGYQGQFTERQMLHTALAYNQVPVDILPENEIADRLDNYKLLYITDPHVPAAAQAKIEAWVRNGGVLFTQAGAATHDELDKSMNLVERMAGKQATIERVNENIPERYTETINLYSLPTLDTATCQAENLPSFQFEVIGRKESLEIPNAQVLATYSDGKPAAVVFDCGKGKVIRIGTSLGAVLARTATPKFEAPKDEYASTRVFDTNIEKLYLFPLKLASTIKRPVNAGMSGIDAGLFETADKAIVLLADYSSAETRIIDLALTLSHTYSGARTLDGQPLEFSMSDASRAIVKNVPLKNIQYVVLENLKP